MTSSGEVSPTPGTPSGTPSLVTQAPKYGTLIPNRIFVGGIATNTSDAELKQYFSAYGAVKDCKIIADRGGVSKGYGFVTFETQEDAEKIIKKEGENLIFKDRKLNIGPAIRKQAFPRMFEPSLTPGTLMFTNGVPYTYQNGMAVFHPPEGYQVPTTPQPAYPMMMPHGQHVYVSQPNFAYQSPTAGASATQWQAAAAASPWCPRWTPPSPATPTLTAASQYTMYPIQTMPPEMIYAHLPPQTAYQPADITDASMMEAAAAEGSMVMEPNIVAVPPRYVEASAATVGPLAALYAHSLASYDPQPTQQQQTVVKSGAYKRPIPPTPRKLITSQGVAYSPRATPPMKMAAVQGPGGQRMVAKHAQPPISFVTKLSSVDKADSVLDMALTPPATPQAKLVS